MTINAIEDALKREPFLPFEIHLDSGTVVRVVHPDCVWFTPGGKTAVVAEGEHLRIMSVDHISSLSVVNA